MKHFSNEQLLAEYQKSWPEAFDAFFRRNYRLIFGYFLVQLGSRSEAEDALLETFVRANRAILSYDTSQSALLWIFSIAKGVCRDRSSKDNHHRQNTADKLNSEQMLETKKHLATLLAKLSAAERTLIKRCFIDEIANKSHAKADCLSP